MGAPVAAAVEAPPSAPPPAAIASPFPVTIRVDAAQPVGKMEPFWAMFGYDEPNYTTMRDGKKLLSQLAALATPTGVPVQIRAHNLLTTGDGTPALKWGSTNAYTEDADGRPHYDWTIVDRIFDTYRERGIKPFVQLGFMPQALSIEPEPYQHHWTPKDKYSAIYTGWARPPKDYAKWGELVFQWAQHCGERYGAAEAASWRWELWNEPDGGYWKATPEEYCKLYDYSVAAVRRALPSARVGGPHVTGPRGERAANFLRTFIEHCLRGKNYITGEIGTPLDFVAFHAKGSPKYLDNHVQTGLGAQLAHLDAGFAIVASYPELKNIPIFIGESDPDGCAACSAEVHPQNGYRTTALFASYTAAAMARHYALADRRGVNLAGAVTWAFEFEDQPWFAGFRVLSTNGVALPVLNVFRMLGQMGGTRVRADSSADAGLDALIKNSAQRTPDVAALAARRDRELTVLVWHHHDDDTPGPAATAVLTLAGLPAAASHARVQHWRIDHDHSNAFTAWLAMGSPQSPTAAQLTALEKAGELTELAAPAELTFTDGTAAVALTLPRQSVSLLKITW